jgi:hypothetical protein
VKEEKEKHQEAAHNGAKVCVKSNLKNHMQFDEIFCDYFLLPLSFFTTWLCRLSNFIFCYLRTNHSGHLKSNNQMKKPQLADWSKTL